MEIKNPQQVSGGSQGFSLSVCPQTKHFPFLPALYSMQFFMLVVVEYYHNYSHYRFKYRIIHVIFFFLFNFLHITMCLKNCH